MRNARDPDKPVASQDMISALNLIADIARQSSAEITLKFSANSEPNTTNSTTPGKQLTFQQRQAEVDRLIESLRNNDQLRPDDVELMQTEWVTTQDAATYFDPGFMDELKGSSDRIIRNHCAKGRLFARKGDDGRWMVSSTSCVLKYYDISDPRLQEEE